MKSITIMMFLLLSVLTGSVPSDFEKQTDQTHPFEPCPSSPNCIIHSVEFDITEADLFSKAQDVIEIMNPYEFSVDVDSFRIDAVFRIPVFGFKDDVEIVVQKTADAKSVLHIKSASRVGYGDLGVNSRRVKRFFNNLNELN